MREGLLKNSEEQITSKVAAIVDLTKQQQIKKGLTQKTYPIAQMIGEKFEKYFKKQRKGNKAKAL